MHKITVTKAALAVALLQGIVSSGCSNEVNEPRDHSKPEYASPSIDGAPTYDQVVGVLKRREFDSAIATMNQIKKSRYKNDLVLLLQKIWNKDASLQSHVDMEFANQPRIRIEMADVLIQASKNGVSGLDDEEYAAYAREHVNSADADVARQAILVLGLASDARDAPLLIQILKNENEETFPAAAIAISHSCAMSKSQISEIESQLKNRENSTYLSKAWADLDHLRNVACSKSTQ